MMMFVLRLNFFLKSELHFTQDQKVKALDGLQTLTWKGCLSSTRVPSAWWYCCLHHSGIGPDCDETEKVTDDRLVQMHA